MLRKQYRFLSCNQKQHTNKDLVGKPDAPQKVRRLTGIFLTEIKHLAAPNMSNVYYNYKKCLKNLHTTDTVKITI